MAVLPGVLGCRPLRRTVQVRLETNPAVPRDALPGGTPILFALAALRSVPQAGSQFRGLATAIHEISGLTLYTDPLPFKVSIRFLCNPVEAIHIKQTCFHRLVLERFLVMPICLLPEIRTGSSDAMLSGDIVIAELIPDFEKTFYMNELLLRALLRITV
jgi:hypothetical protein